MIDSLDDMNEKLHIHHTTLLLTVAGSYTVLKGQTYIYIFIYTYIFITWHLI
jgi:intein-encoded DNA endonuclease-like protein